MIFDVIILLETKLLAKTVALAQLVQSRTALTRTTGSDNATVRFRMLLLALLQVAGALGAIDKVIGMTDRNIELIKLLSYFSFTQALELLRDSRWVMAVQKKIMQAKLKRFFFRWAGRTRVHASVTMPRRRMVPPPAFSDVILKPVLRHNHQRPMNGKDIAFNQWQLAFRAKRVLACKVVEIVQRALRVWRQWTKLKRTFENYCGYIPIGNDENLIGQATAAGPIALARFVFKEWRGGAKLQRRRVRDGISEKRGRFENWKEFTLKKLNIIKLATLYDQTRNARPAFCAWLTVCTRTSFATEQARIYDRRRVLEKSINHWYMKKKILFRANTALGKWRSVRDFHQRQMETSRRFYMSKLIANALQRWRTNVVIAKTMKKSAEVMIGRRMRRTATLCLNVWRGVHRWVERNSEKMRTVRANRDARSLFNRWRVWKETKQTSDTLYRSNLVRAVLLAWKRRCELKRANELLREEYLESWRRVLRTKQSVRRFNLQRTNSSINLLKKIPRNLSWEVHLTLGDKLEIVNNWKKHAVLTKQGEMYELRKNQMIKSDVLKGWRMDANVVFYLRQ